MNESMNELWKKYLLFDKSFITYQLLLVIINLVNKLLNIKT